MIWGSALNRLNISINSDSEPSDRPIEDAQPRERDQHHMVNVDAIHFVLQ